MRVFKEQNGVKSVEDRDYVSSFLMFDEIYKRFGADEETCLAAWHKYDSDLELAQLHEAVF